MDCIYWGRTSFAARPGELTQYPKLTLRGLAKVGAERHGKDLARHFKALDLPRTFDHVVVGPEAICPFTAIHLEKGWQKEMGSPLVKQRQNMVIDPRLQSWHFDLERALILAMAEAKPHVHESTPRPAVQIILALTEREGTLCSMTFIPKRLEAVLNYAVEMLPSISKMLQKQVSIPDAVVYLSVHGSDIAKEYVRKMIRRDILTVTSAERRLWEKGDEISRTLTTDQRYVGPVMGMLQTLERATPDLRLAYAAIIRTAQEVERTWFREGSCVMFLTAREGMPELWGLDKVGHPGSLRYLLLLAESQGIKGDDYTPDTPDDPSSRYNEGKIYARRSINLHKWSEETEREVIGRLEACIARPDQQPIPVVDENYPKPRSR